MKFLLKIAYFSILLSTSIFCYAQNPQKKALTDKEIEQFIEALQKEQIISEFGKDGILKGFKSDGGLLPTNRFPVNQKFNFPDSVKKSRAVILGALAIFEIMKNVGMAADELVQYRELTEKFLGEEMLFKPSIETEVSSQKPETFIGLEFDISKVKSNYLNLATKLQKIGLIDQKVHDEAIIWLKRDRFKLLKDFGFFVYLARQTWFYDNYDNLKKEQIKLIDSLRLVKLLPEEKAKNLIASFRPFELKNKIEILNLCNNTFSISVEQGNFTRAELYENLFNQVKKNLLPNVSFSDLKVTEIIKPKPTFDLNLMANNPLSRFGNFDKDKQNYDITLKINDLAYKQKADTDFGIVKKIKKEIPPNVNIDSTLIDTYANVFSSFLGFTNKDLQVFNDYLTDIHSEKRLFILGNDFNPFNPVKNDKKVVVLLDSVQYKLFSKGAGGVSHFSSLLKQQFGKTNEFSDEKSRDSLNAFVINLQKNGILPTISKDSIENRILELRYDSNQGFGLFLNKKIAKKDFLGEFIEVISDEKKITEKNKKIAFQVFLDEFKRISNGKFNPEKVKDNYASEIEKNGKKDRKFTYSFRLNGQDFEETKEIPKSDEEPIPPIATDKNSSPIFTNDFQIPNHNQWFELVNQALEATKSEGKFYVYDDNIGLKTKFIYLTQPQLDFINKKYPEIFRKDFEQTDIYENYQNTISTYSAEKFADSLKAKNMMTDESFYQLKKDLDLKKSKQPSEILKYSKDAFLVNINELAKQDNSLIYNELVSKINQHLIPETKITEIKYTKKDSTEGYENYLVSAKINGLLYEQKLYVSLRDEMKKAIDSLNNPKAQYYPSIGENQFKIINDYLTDSKNPKRLVIVCDYRSPMLSFVFFDSTQAHLVQETLPNNYVDFKMYEQGLSRDSLTIKIEELQEIGLAKNLSDIQKDSIIVGFRQETQSFYQIFKYFPDLLAESPYNDVDNYEPEKGYVRLIENIKRLSKGKFSPDEITDNFKKMYKKSLKSDRNFQYAFKLNGKIYKDSQLAKGKSKSKNVADFEIGYFYFDESKVLDLINSALNEQNIDGNYHQLNFAGEEDEEFDIKYIFLSGRQYRFLKENYPAIFASYLDDKSADMDEIEEKDK